MTNLIISLAWIALVVGVCALIVYIAPKALDFVKSFIKWHSHDDDDWYL